MNMNMQQLVAQAQKMQKDIMDKREKVDSMTFVGKSDWVEVTVSGDRVVKKTVITNQDACNAENIEILQDMIVLAVNDALLKVEKELENQLGAYSKLGGMF